MKWSCAYIVYRVSESGVLTEVFHHDDLKKAKYWMSYIAEVGDILCRTPAHPKNPPSPQYMNHKDRNGKVSSTFEEWKQLPQSRGFSGSFPSEQLQAAAEA